MPLIGKTAYTVLHAQLEQLIPAAQQAGLTVEHSVTQFPSLEMLKL
jgi:hypothetical protein